MNKRVFFLSSVLSAVLLIGGSAQLAAAEENRAAGEQPEVKSDAMTKSDSKMMMMSGKDSQVRSEIGPHAVTVRTELESAIGQVKGLKAQVSLSEKPSPDQIEHFKMHSKEMNEDIKTAGVHQGVLRSRIGKYPEVARSQEYKSLNTSFTDSERSNRDWQAKTEGADYWQDSKKVMGDLDALERKLNAALDKARRFNTDQLKVMEIG